MSSAGSKSKRFSWRILVISIFILIMILIAGAGFFANKWYKYNLQPVSSLESSVPVVIPSGATTDQIGELLERKNVIKSKKAFYWYVRLSRQNESFQAGSYLIKPGDDVESIVDKIVKGEIDVELFTILPTQRIDQLKTSFVKAGFSREEVNEGFEPKLYADSPVRKYAPPGAGLEGYIYPESFELSPTTTVADIINQSLDELNNVLNPQLRSDLAEQGLTVHEALIMSSIVENEVNNAVDRPMVAQVFLKRYKEGISLGSDPTAFYGSLINGVEKSVFVDSPYNTRIYTGLPPGPISNVSQLSLDAVAHPADTDYLFFVAGDDGVTYFSKTLAEHEALTAQHCTELCQ